VWVYPNKAQVAIQGEENLERYHFKPGHGRLVFKTFCKNCGVQMTNPPNDGLTEEQIAALSDDRKAFLERIKDTVPVNVRILNDVRLRDIKEPYQNKGRQFGTDYENP
jgi:hypothetical protein